MPDQPAHDVYLCHAPGDRRWAEAACAALEGGGLRCWIAPRDIPAGGDWGTAVADGIARVRVVLVFFSDRANASPAVRRELDFAAGRGKQIVAARIGDATPNLAMASTLGDSRWVDAVGPPDDARVGQLTSAVSAVLGRPAAPGARPAPPPPPEPRIPTVRVGAVPIWDANPLPPEQPKAAATRSFRPPADEGEPRPALWPYFAVGALVLAVLGGGYAVMTRDPARVAEKTPVTPPDDKKGSETPVTKTDPVGTKTDPPIGEPGKQNPVPPVKTDPVPPKTKPDTPPAPLPGDWVTATDRDYWSAGFPERPRATHPPACAAVRDLLGGGVLWHRYYHVAGADKDATFVLWVVHPKSRPDDAARATLAEDLAAAFRLGPAGVEPIDAGSVKTGTVGWLEGTAHEGVISGPHGTLVTRVVFVGDVAFVGMVGGRGPRRPERERAFFDNVRPHALK